ncbi:hypothetical protein [Lachnoclostridium phytofermentans]|nr:hypothetical protein [Lachnoclostridium phytofermentans]
MESAIKGLLMAAGVVLTCIVIGIGFYMAREAKSTAMSSAESLSDFKREISEKDINRFDDREVTGSDVVNFTRKELRKYKSGQEAPVSVKISTSLGNYTYENNTMLKELRDITSARYVDPLAMFQGKVVRDDNDVIIRVEFTQK